MNTEARSIFILAKIETCPLGRHSLASITPNLYTTNLLFDQVNLCLVLPGSILITS